MKVVIEKNESIGDIYYNENELKKKIEKITVKNKIDMEEVKKILIGIDQMITLSKEKITKIKKEI